MLNMFEKVTIYKNGQKISEVTDFPADHDHISTLMEIVLAVTATEGAKN